MCERSSGKAHHKATKFFDFTAPPYEKNRRILHKQLRRCAVVSDDAPAYRKARCLIGRVGQVGRVRRRDIQLVLSSQRSDPSDLPDIALTPLAGGGRGAILLPGLVITKPGNSDH